MQVGEPSRTARAAAFHRAALQVLEHGRIFADPLALRILGEYADAVAREAERRPSGRGMRIFIAVRTRFAEDALAAAVERGVPQLVVLGAGLETTGSLARFRGRSSSPAGLEAPAPRRGWHPAAGGADVRSIGFERETLAEGLAAAGFDPSAWTFFTWLGVVPI
ncbi:MAG TPA: class I SAM-dependent methyltransferase [Bryobacteraceae bacterium]|jgi:O-methyltransferase involved in polyketide biosynthesis